MRPHRSIRMYDVKTATTIRRRVLKNRTRAPARCSGVNPRRTCLENHVKRTSKPRCIYDSCRRLESCSRDPIGFAGSEWNLYEYVDGAALNGLDPSGLFSVSCDYVCGKVCVVATTVVCFVIGLGIGRLIGALIGAVVCNLVSDEICTHYCEWRCVRPPFRPGCRDLINTDPDSR
ncbi:hypothetical protein Q31b_47410 [Novipirellula aureliae]|uniref:Uncharacterized protein n=1 Tax=Novipirellula aureliae TaxID=2527966 RepID=A0A5C6DMR9_9BACT|nr:hypothetical protein Q31b_47410 [Novipirellula aureliae]